MEQFIIYLIKVNGLIIFFWAFYKLFLQKETFYTINRFYFIIAVLIAFALPLISITKFEEVILPATSHQALKSETEHALKPNIFKEVSWFETLNWLLITISIVGSVSVVKMIIRLKKIHQLVQSILELEKHPTEKNIRISDHADAVYSFYKWIVMPKNLINIESSAVLIQHEKVHIQQKHSADLVLFAFLQDIFWFNPIIKKIQKDVNLNLEYIVDEEITRNENSYQYQKTLINYNQNTKTPILTNAFKTSDLKKRILMINAQKSSPMKKLKIILTTPALLLFFGLFQIETIAQVKNNDFTIEANSEFNENTDLILEILKKDIKPIQQDKTLFTEILKKYTTTINGEQITKEEIERFDNSKIKSIEVDFSNNKTETKVNLLTTGEENHRAFTFRTQPNEANFNAEDQTESLKEDKNSFSYKGQEYSENRYDKILIDGKESTEKELVDLYNSKKNVSVKMNGRNIVVETIDKEIINKANEQKAKSKVEHKKAEIERVKAEANKKTASQKNKDAAKAQKMKKEAIATNKKTPSDNTEKDIETVTSIFNDLKKDIKKIEDEDIKITEISASIIQADGTKITVSEKY